MRAARAGPQVRSRRIAKTPAGGAIERGGGWPLLPARTPVHSAAVITLHTMPGTNELESMSPFCMKVEVYLKLQKLPYKTWSGDPRKAPKGKLPMIEADGTKICDSSAIIAHLEANAEKALDADLDAAARARSHVLQRMLEEGLYFVVLWSRWGDDRGWSALRPRIEAVVPAAVRWFLPGMIRKKVVAQSVAQGTGRHSPDEIYAMGKADLEALSGVLGDQPYFLGDTMHTIDIVAYAFLAQIVLWTKASPLTDAARALPNLEAFVKRMKARVEESRAAAA